MQGRRCRLCDRLQVRRSIQRRESNSAAQRVAKRVASVLARTRTLIVGALGVVALPRGAPIEPAGVPGFEVAEFCQTVQNCIASEQPFPAGIQFRSRGDRRLDVFQHFAEPFRKAFAQSPGLPVLGGPR